MQRNKGAAAIFVLIAGAGAAAAVACGDSGGGESTFVNGGDDGGGDGSGGRGTGVSGEFGRDDGGAGDGAFDPDAACASTVAEAKRSGVDIVFVIDNSHSMVDEIRKVQENLNALATTIAGSGIDYRVIMLSAKGTQLDDGRENVANLKGCQTADLYDYPREVCVPAPLAGAGCADGARFFHLDHFPMGVASTNALSLVLGMYPSSYTWGPGGNGCATHAAQPTGGGWSRFARFDAMKFFVAISDDDAKFPAATATEEVHQVFDRKLLEDLNPPGMFGTKTARRYVYNAIVGWHGYPGGQQVPAGTLPGATGCASTAADGGLTNFAMNQGDQHRKLAALTGGVVDSICKESWAGILSNLAQSVVSRIGCEYDIPRPPNVILDPDKATVRYTPTSGAPEDLNRVASAAACAGPRDWYYDNASDPKKVFLCPAACTTLGNNANGRIDVRIACGGLIPR